MTREEARELLRILLASMDDEPPRINPRVVLRRFPVARTKGPEASARGRDGWGASRP